MGAVRVLPLAALVAGAVLLGDAVLRGGASLAVYVVVPVVAGNSAEFFLGVLLLFVGFVTLPFAVGSSFGASDEPSEAVHHGGEAPAGEIGGVILLGPLPLLFGSARRASPALRWSLAVIGGAVLVVLLVWLAVALR